MRRMLTEGVLALAFVAALYPAAAQDGAVLASDSVPWSRFERFQKLYAPFLGKGNDLITKIVNNYGNGYEELYGVRNFRVVLHGVMYRGGANNYYHRINKRDNSNPLPQDGLQNLCEESFGEAIYLYEKNFEPKTVTCTSRTGNSNRLDYSQISVLASPINGDPNQIVDTGSMMLFRGNEVREILEKVHACAVGLGACPIYTHCWNGWHASGLISAVALRQFCDFSPEEAVSYWVDGTDSLNNSNYPALKQSIREFNPIPELKVAKEIQAEICPQNPYHTASFNSTSR